MGVWNQTRPGSVTHGSCDHRLLMELTCASVYYLEDTDNKSTYSIRLKQLNIQIKKWTIPEAQGMSPLAIKADFKLATVYSDLQI